MRRLQEALPPVSEDRLRAIIEETRPFYRTMTEMVSAALRKAILEGLLESGSSIRQDRLAAEFGISRMPIREALRQLEAEGLVEFFPHRGCIVASFEAADFIEMSEIRLLLECHALTKLVGSMSQASLRTASDILDRLDEEPDMGKMGELNRLFHMAIYEDLRGSRLHAMIETQYKMLDRVVRLVLSQLEYTKVSQQEHRRLLRHCADGETDAAIATLRLHVNKSTKHLARLLPAEDKA